MSDLSELLKPHVAAIEASADAGNEDAKRVIRWYEMHRRCPGDPGARVICEQYFKEWKSDKEKGR